MSKLRIRGLLIALTLGFALLVVFVLPAAGQPPQNDDRSFPTNINVLPFTETLDTLEATQGYDDPYLSCPSFYGAPEATVWYAYTPLNSEAITASTVGSDYDTILAIFDQYGNQLACSSSGAPLIIGLNGSENYSFMVGANNQAPYPYPGPGVGGLLQFSIEAAAGPDNDAFADAAGFNTVPFEDFVDLSAATTEAGEPTPNCTYYYGAMNTVWYAFTPDISGSYSIEVRDNQFEAFYAAYSGSTLGSLSELGCQTAYYGGGLLTFAATAGVTYYIQAGAANPYNQVGALRLTLDVTPPPMADFSFYPYNPSQFDQIEFYDQSYDPAWVGIESYAWTFGDGTTGEGCCLQHSYGADGDYTVELTVTTYDGRTATASQTVHVETHDVAITKFKTPNSVKAGQTRNITVGLRNNLFDENVTVYLYRSTPNGYEYVGNLTQQVPVRSGNRTTDFQFSYTFTAEDANQGSVTFRAEAQLNGHRDALPADNEAISAPPTNVNP